MKWNFSSKCVLTGEERRHDQGKKIMRRNVVYAETNGKITYAIVSDWLQIRLLFMLTTQQKLSIKIFNLFLALFTCSFLSIIVNNLRELYLLSS